MLTEGIHQLFHRKDADLSPPLVRGTQMILLFHLQNHRREILLLPLIRLPCINLECSSGRRHSRAYGSREIENQPEILIHQPNRELRAVVVLHRAFQFADMRWSNHCSLGQHVQQAIAIETRLLSECNGLGEKAGLDRNRLLNVLSQTAVIAPAHVGKLESAMKNDYSPQFPIRLMNKDFGLILNLAAAVGARMPAAGAAFETNARQSDQGQEQDF